jgi:lipoprotein
MKKYFKVGAIATALMIMTGCSSSIGSTADVDLKTYISSTLGQSIQHLEEMKGKVDYAPTAKVKESIESKQAIQKTIAFQSGHVATSTISNPTKGSLNDGAKGAIDKKHEEMDKEKKAKESKSIFSFGKKETPVVKMDKFDAPELKSMPKPEIKANVASDAVKTEAVNPLDRKLSVGWNGDAKNLLSLISAKAGYKFGVEGKAKSLPVSIKKKSATLKEFLGDVAQQLHQKADIKLSTKDSSLTLSYKE